MYKCIHKSCLNKLILKSMLDEGLAREVINRIQKLRKKANLSPSDDVTAYFRIQVRNVVEKNNLANVLLTY